MTPAELEQLPIFGGCLPEDLRPVVEAITGTREVGAGEVVCAEGDKADRWWVVEDGLADVTVGGLFVGGIGAGETIGELALLDGEPRAATVTAVTAMRLVEVDGEGFVGALLASPRLSVALLHELATRLRSANLRPQRTPAPSPPVSPAVEVRSLDRRVADDLADPAAHFAAVRESVGVQWSEELSSFLVTRYDDVYRLCRDPALAGSVTTLSSADVEATRTAGTRPRGGHRMMIRRDGDDHFRLRRLVAKAFTPRGLLLWRERAEAIVERLLAAAQERVQIDVIADYALPLPAQVISEMLGMPQEDTARLRTWSRALSRGLDPFSSAAEEQASQDAGRAMSDYLRLVIADKRKATADDILGALLSAEVDGQRLDDNDVVAQVTMLYIAGHETTMNLIGNGVTHAFRFPDQLDRLRADPALDANAVEEVLRFDGPAQLTRRVALQPMVVGGVDMPRGTHLTLCLASANRDPRKWGSTADVLDLARPGANEHVSFGGGPHYCLGASLARLEAGIALPRLLRRFPRMQPAYEQPAWGNRMTLRGVESLPVMLNG